MGPGSMSGASTSNSRGHFSHRRWLAADMRTEGTADLGWQFADGALQAFHVTLHGVSFEDHLALQPYKRRVRNGRSRAAKDGGYIIVEGGGIPAVTVIGYNPIVDWEQLLARLVRASESGRGGSNGHRRGGPGRSAERCVRSI